MGSIKSPQLHGFIVGARSKALHTWHRAKSTDNVRVCLKLLELLSVAPHLDHSGLVASNHDVVNLDNRGCVCVPFQLSDCVSRLQIPNANSAVPAATQKVIATSVEE